MFEESYGPDYLQRELEKVQLAWGYKCLGNLRGIL